MAAFKNIATMTDIHFGKRGDSEVHNTDCLEYVEWFCSEVRRRKSDTVCMMGDWYDNRSRIRLDTIWESKHAAKLLNDLDLPVMWLIGNHDMFYRDNRRIHSHPFLELYPNIHVLNEITKIEDTLFCPYLIGEEHSEVSQIDSRYVFGHFEFATFLTNEWYEYEDKGGLHPDMLEYPEWVFSGHFHKRQIKKNQNGVKICYTGNCFPLDFNDTNDRDRGAMFFEHGGVPEFENWKAGPSYNRISITEMLELIDQDRFEQKFNPKSVIECHVDVNIPDEDQIELKEYAQSVTRSFYFKPGDQVPEATEQQAHQGDDLDKVVVKAIRSLEIPVGSRIDPVLLEGFYKGVCTA